MLFLPTPITANASVQPQFALSPRAAEELWQALCLQSSEQRIAQFSATLALEPALALWITQCASGETPTDIAALATWLDCDGLAQLALLEPVDDAQPSSEQMRLFTACAMLAQKSELAFPNDREAAGQSHILGLLFLAPRLAKKDATDAMPLPVWLTTLTGPTVRSNAPPVAAAVRELVCDLFGRACLTSGAAPKPSLLNRALLKKIQSRWQARRSRAEQVLPQLASRLASFRRLENSFQETLEREKVAAMYALAYGAGHEFNNPLANISSRAQTLLRDENDPERQQKLAMINSQAFRAHEMIANMMLFAKPPALHRAEVELQEVLATLRRELAPLALEQGATLEIQCNEISQPVFLDQQQLLVGLRALVTNALQATESAGVVSVQAKLLRAEQFAESSCIEIRVVDNGPGFDEATRRHLFDPFFSGREAGRGLGFGLCWCWRVVEMHGGSMVVSSQIGEGAEFVLRLPCSQDAI